MSCANVAEKQKAAYTSYDALIDLLHDHEKDISVLLSRKNLNNMVQLACSDEFPHRLYDLLSQDNSLDILKSFLKEC